MSGSDYERKLNYILEDKYDWLSIRAAGSMGDGDIVAIHPDHENSPMVIEVKKSSREPYRTTVTQETKEQFEMMQEHASRGINTIYAVRFLRGDTETQWQIYWVSGDEEDYPIRRRGDGLTLEEVFG